MSSEECTYINTYTGAEFTKTCYTSCCEEDCCGDDGSSGTSAGLVAGITVPVFFAVFFLLFCCRVWMRRQATATNVVVTGPTRGITVIRTTVTRAGAPVPQHEGYDQPNYQPSRMPSPAQFQPPPPYTEQVPKADV